MADLGIKDAITKQLDQLPPELQRRVLHFAQGLAQSPRKGEPGRELLRFAGLLDDTSAREMMEAIEADCERVDADEW
jgi:hypothetical protein